jgi:hypothetical protein
MGGANVVDYLIGDHKSLRNSISNFSICNKQPDSKHYPLYFRICHSVELRLPCLSNHGRVLHPNPKKANQYVLNIKHEFSYMQGETYTSLDKHA